MGGELRLIVEFPDYPPVELSGFGEVEVFPLPNPPALARRFARAKGKERIGALFHNVEITLCLQQESPLIKGGRR
jgi:hypothetical protein